MVEVDATTPALVYLLPDMGRSSFRHRYLANYYKKLYENSMPNRRKNETNHATILRQSLFSTNLITDAAIIY